jgi:hypothetical protein
MANHSEIDVGVRRESFTALLVEGRTYRDTLDRTRCSR